MADTIRMRMRMPHSAFSQHIRYAHDAYCQCKHTMAVRENFFHPFFPYFPSKTFLMHFILLGSMRKVKEQPLSVRIKFKPQTIFRENLYEFS